MSELELSQTPSLEEILRFSFQEDLEFLDNLDAIYNMKENGARLSQAQISTKLAIYLKSPVSDINIVGREFIRRAVENFCENNTHIPHPSARKSKFLRIFFWNLE